MHFHLKVIIVSDNVKILDLCHADSWVRSPAVASLRLVSPATVADGVTIFSVKKVKTF